MRKMTRAALVVPRAVAKGVSVFTAYQKAYDELLENKKLIGKDGKARPAKYKPRQHKTVIATNKAHWEGICPCGAKNYIYQPSWDKLLNEAVGNTDVTM
ncbi:hypothetical protein ES705_40388 [subsurface metagenome]